MKTRLAAILLCVVMIFALGACSQQPSTAPAADSTPAPAAESTPAPAAESTPAPADDSQETVTLTFATSLYVEEPHQKALDALLEAYNQKNPNVQIEIYGADYQNFWNNVTTEIIAGNEADIIQIGPDRLASYHALRPGGAFVVLDPYMQATGMDYENQVVGQVDCKVDGQNVALSCYAWGTTGLFYRKSILEAEGIDPASIKNSDDFVAALKATTKGDMVGMGVVVGTHSFVTSEWIRMFNRGVSGGFYFKEEAAPYDAEHLNINSVENVWLAQWWQDLILKDKVLKPGPDKKDARELFWNGLAPFNLDGPWFIGMTESRDPALLEDTGLLPHPEMIYEGKSYKARPSYSPYINAISSNCQNVDAAWEFSDWMLSDEAQAIIATCGMTPVNKQFAETDSYKQQYPLSYSFLGFMENSYGPLLSDPRIPQMNELSQIGVDAGQEMFSDKGADPKATLDAAREQMAAALNK